ncbi:uncharacterized protein VTP21DRAFT_4474 [Calcarisporiella thermophila]|uniref:uncharacterized protein n=1 Tax=Calcarisporiella thermophila TaxID=911321 RepID=UPI003743278E
MVEQDSKNLSIETAEDDVPPLPPPLELSELLQDWGHDLSNSLSTVSASPFYEENTEGTCNDSTLNSFGHADLHAGKERIEYPYDEPEIYSNSSVPTFSCSRTVNSIPNVICKDKSLNADHRALNPKQIQKFVEASDSDSSTDGPQASSVPPFSQLSHRSAIKSAYLGGYDSWDDFKEIPSIAVHKTQPKPKIKESTNRHVANGTRISYQSEDDLRELEAGLSALKLSAAMSKSGSQQDPEDVFAQRKIFPATPVCDLLQTKQQCSVGTRNRDISAPALNEKCNPTTTTSSPNTSLSSADKPIVTKTMPDYASYSLNELKKAVKKYGLKPMGRRIMIAQLEKIWRVLNEVEESNCQEKVEKPVKVLEKNQTHPEGTDEGIPSEADSASTDEEDIESGLPGYADVFSDNHCDEEEKFADEDSLDGRIYQRIRDDIVLYERILRYEPIDFELLLDDLMDVFIGKTKRVSVEILRRFLDTQGICFFLPEGTGGWQRKRDKKGKKNVS